MLRVRRQSAFAIVPSNDLPAAIAFWERLVCAARGETPDTSSCVGLQRRMWTQPGRVPRRVPEEQ